MSRGHHPSDVQSPARSPRAHVTCDLTCPCLAPRFLGPALAPACAQPSRHLRTFALALPTALASLPPLRCPPLGPRQGWARSVLAAPLLKERLKAAPGRARCVQEGAGVSSPPVTPQCRTQARSAADGSATAGPTGSGLVGCPLGTGARLSSLIHPNPSSAPTRAWHGHPQSLSSPRPRRPQGTAGWGSTSLPSAPEPGDVPQPH